MSENDKGQSQESPKPQESQKKPPKPVEVEAPPLVIATESFAPAAKNDD
jgi:hypothetical protein